MKVDMINNTNLKSDFDIKKETNIQETPYEIKMRSLSNKYSLEYDSLKDLRLQKKITSKEYMKRVFKLEQWLEKNRKAVEKEFILPIQKMTQKPWWKKLLHI